VKEGPATAVADSIVVSGSFALSSAAHWVGVIVAAADAGAAPAVAMKAATAAATASPVAAIVWVRRMWLLLSWRCPPRPGGRRPHLSGGELSEHIR
jgi:hypothetical protein